jgi:micrococcal nuclease
VRPLALLVLAAVAAVAVMSGVDLGSDGPLGAGGVREAREDGNAGGSRVARVTRVVDGDTIRLGDERVRLIGVDTPETKRPGTPVECFGREATAFTKRLLEGRRVRLELDVESRDRYGRLLAYVRRADDGLFVNAELVAQGYATVLTVPPNVRHAARFLQLQRRARDDRRGLWSAR